MNKERLSLNCAEGREWKGQEMIKDAISKGGFSNKFSVSGSHGSGSCVLVLGSAGVAKTLPGWLRASVELETGAWQCGAECSRMGNMGLGRRTRAWRSDLKIATAAIKKK